MHNRIVNLLKKSPFTALRRSYQTTVQQASLYAGLFSHTAKSNTQFDFDLRTPAVQSLRAAISSGAHDAPVFSDPRCHLYVLYLIKNNHLDFWQGMTVYTYLIALMQYTKKQALHPDDQPLKIAAHTHAGVAFDYLSKDQQLTPFGKKYFASMQTKLARFKITLDADAFQQFAARLTPTDAWMLRINYDNYIVPFDENYDKTIRIIIYSSPLIYFETTPHISHFYMPSFTVIRYLLAQIAPQPLEMQPIFGNISDAEFFTMHQTNQHPVALYDPDSTDNLVEPHGLRCGPYPAMLHDVAGHAFWGTLFSAAERASLYSTFIPAIKKIMADAENYFLDDRKLAVQPKLSLLGKLNLIILQVIDYDLNDLEFFADPDTRFIKYLARSFGEKAGELLYPELQNYYMKLALGDCQADHIYFLLKKHFYQTSAPATPEGLWSKLLTYLQTHTKANDQQPTVLIALDVLARLAAGLTLPAQPKKRKIDWPAWQLLLEQHADSDALWQAAKKNHYHDLLALMTDYQLLFFPPQHRLEAEQMPVFKAFIVKNLESDNAVTWPEFHAELQKNRLKP